MYIGRNSKVGALRRIEMLCAQLRAGAACRRSQLCVCRHNVPAQPVTCAGTQVPAHAGCVPAHAGAAGVCRCKLVVAGAASGAGLCAGTSSGAKQILLFTLDSSKTRAAESLLLREWLSHCSPGLTPSSRTQPTHMYVRACHARVLCVLSYSPPCAVLVADYVCRLQQCSGHPLTHLLLLAGSGAAGKGSR